MAKGTKTRKPQRSAAAQITARSSKPIYFIMILMVIGGAGYLAWLYFRPTPEVVLPQNLARLDPAVQALIRSKAVVAKAQPHDASAHGDLGLVYEANLLWPEARRCFETAAKLDPNEMPWQLHLALAHRQTGAPAEALERLRNLAKKNPAASYLQQRLGQMLLETGDLNEAESAFRKLIDLAPNTAPGYIGLGDILLQKKDDQQAVPLLEKAVALEPNYKTAHYLLGTAYQRLGLQEKAEIELAQGLNASVRFLPDPASARVQQYAVNLTARLQQAQEALHQGNAQHAVQLLEEIRAQHSENVSLLNELAVAYMRLGQFNEAKELLRQAQQRPDGQYMTMINFSALLFRADQPQQALAYADSAIGLAPKMEQGYFSRSQALWRMNRYQEALASLQEALRLNPINSQSLSFAGDLFMKIGNHEKARASYQSALKLDVKMLPALVGLAKANWELGRHAEAQDAFAQARSVAPEHPLVRRLEQQLATAK